MPTIIVFFIIFAFLIMPKDIILFISYIPEILLAILGIAILAVLYNIYREKALRREREEQLSPEAKEIIAGRTRCYSLTVALDNNCVNLDEYKLNCTLSNLLDCPYRQSFSHFFDKPNHVKGHFKKGRYVKSYTRRNKKL